MNPVWQEKPKRMTPKLSDAIDAVDLGIRKYLLHRHLAHWNPISTAPYNRALVRTAEATVTPVARVWDGNE
jgi:hypothetical protein